MKFSDYTVVDIEAPNNKHHSLCQIAVMEVKDDKVVWEYDSLVNPEEEFDQECIDIHGIYPEDVADAPSFDEIWPIIAPHYLDHVIVAHSASFDVSSISKVLRRYGINIGRVRYMCTYRLAFKIFNAKKTSASALKKRPSGLGLKVLCDFYGINLTNHHNAKADTEACWKVLLALKEDCGISPEDFHSYICPDPSIPEEKRDYAELGSEGTSYCITGKFFLGSTGRVKEFIKKRRGVFHDILHRDTDFLIQGGISPGRGINGGKAGKAAELIKQGYPIRIISEKELLQAFGVKIKGTDF